MDNVQNHDNYRVNCVNYTLLRCIHDIYEKLTDQHFVLIYDTGFGLVA
jgi:hypothetical protein